MSTRKTTGAAGREKVEPGIWKRTTADRRDVYEITYRDANGKQRRSTVRGGIAAARKALTDARSKRDKGERVAADRRLTFNAAADAWWEGRASKLRPGTQDAYGSALAHLRREFGRSRLTEITSADLATYLGRERAKGVKGWTLRGRLVVVGCVFKYASRHLGAVAPNPVAGLERHERPSVEDQRAHRVLSMDELERLLACASDRHRLMFRFASATGARLGEVLGLTWADVALDREEVTFTEQLQRKRGKGTEGGGRMPLKSTKSRRTIEVTPELAVALREHKAASAYSRDHDLVWPTRTGRGLDHGNVRGALAMAVKRAGLEAVERDGRVVLPAPTFHDLRHTHASALIAHGWDVVEVSRRLGHSDPAITGRIYSHEFERARRSDERRSRLAALYDRGSIVAAPHGSEAQEAGQGADVVSLR